MSTAATQDAPDRGTSTEQEKGSSKGKSTEPTALPTVEEAREKKFGKQPKSRVKTWTEDEGKRVAEHMRQEQRDFDKFAELAEGYGMQLPEELEEFRTKRPKAPRRKLVKPPVLKIPKTRPRQGEDDYEGVEEEEKEFDPQPPRKKRPIVKRVVTYHEEGEEVSASEAEEEAPAPRSRPREERTPPSKFSGKNLPPKRPVSLPSRHEGIGAHSREAYIDDPIGTNPPQRREVQKPAGRAYMGEADGPIREVQRTFKWV